jgi:DNA-nicking Smr family endonuclease
MTGPLNSHTKRAIRRGRLKAEASLDLHGLRGHEAQDAVEAFVLRAVRRGCRAVHVITGKGDLKPRTGPAPGGRQRRVSRSAPQKSSE